MNFRTLAGSTCIALALIMGMLHFGSKLKFGSYQPTDADQQQFSASALAKLNLSRGANSMAELTVDPEVQSWLDERLEFFIDENAQVDVKGMLDELPLKLHTITSAATRTIEAEDLDALLPQLDYWVEGFSEETKVIATRLYTSKRGKVGCALIAAKKLPRFNIALLNEGITEFYNTCAHCEEPHLGTVTKVNLALAVNCPSCRNPYDLLAADMLGNYHRANSFLEGMRPPPGVGTDATTRYDEMMAMWSAAVEHCRYTVDLSGANGAKDTWQLPSETYSFRNGDCEDSALMLTDWLISRGFEARVAVGHALGQGGHAWCVVRLDDHQYLLETTLRSAPQSPPEPVLVRDKYQPHYLFDRDSLHFPKGQPGTIIDYFSPDWWLTLSYPYEEITEDALAGGADLLSP